MGKSPDAIIAYGYALGGDEDGWNVREANEDNIWVPHWLDAEVTQDSYGIDQFGDAKSYLQQQQCHGVELVTYGHENGLGYALTTWSTEVSWSEIKRLTLNVDHAQRSIEQWDIHLADAIDKLKITPVIPAENWDDPHPSERTPVQPSFLLLARYF